MPRMISTARLALSLLGFSLLLPRLSIAAPLITHRLSPMQADGMPTQGGIKASRSWYQSWIVATADVLSAQHDSPPRRGAVFHRTCDHAPAPRSSVVSQPDGRTLSGGARLLPNCEWNSRHQSREPGSRKRHPSTQVFDAVGGGRSDPASIPAGGVKPPPGIIAQRLIDGTGRVDTGRASTPPAPAAAAVATPAPATPSAFLRRGKRSWVGVQFHREGSFRPEHRDTLLSEHRNTLLGSAGSSQLEPDHVHVRGSDAGWAGAEQRLPVVSHHHTCNLEPDHVHIRGSDSGRAGAWAGVEQRLPVVPHHHAWSHGRCTVPDRRLSSRNLFDWALRINGFRDQPDIRPRDHGYSSHLNIVSTARGGREHNQSHGQWYHGAIIDGMIPLNLSQVAMWAHLSPQVARLQLSLVPLASTPQNPLINAGIHRGYLDRPSFHDECDQCPLDCPEPTQSRIGVDVREHASATSHGTIDWPGA